MNKQNEIVIYTIEASTLKKFIIIDCITGTGVYYVVKIISASVLLSIVGSVVASEGLKKIFPSKK